MMNANTRLLTADQIDLAAQLLRDQRLVAFPTDTVYGLGTLAFDGSTALKLYIAKERPPEKAIPILMADIGDLAQVAIDVPPIAYRLMEAFWPGALTIVVPKQPTVPLEVSVTPPRSRSGARAHAPHRPAGRDQRQSIVRSQSAHCVRSAGSTRRPHRCHPRRWNDARRCPVNRAGLHTAYARHPARGRVGRSCARILARRFVIQSR
jgi:hypothetical protein